MSGLPTSSVVPSVISNNMESLLVAAVDLCAKELRSWPYAGKRRYSVNGSSLRTNPDVPPRMMRMITILRWLGGAGGSIPDEMERIQSASSTDPLPHWLGTPFGAGLVDPSRLVACLAMAVDESDGRLTPATSVLRFAELVARPTVVMRVEARLGGHAALAEGTQVEFANGVTLMSLSDREMEQELDDVFDSSLDFRVDQRLVLRTQIEAPLETTSWGETTELPEDPLRTIRTVVDVLHALKPGVARIASWQIVPAEPVLAGILSSSTGVISPWRLRFVLDAPELSGLKQFVDDLLRPCRTELAVAMRRLREAEGRSSSTDALVDAVIGIEALLNTENKPEVTMRVAMNYACLFPLAERPQRYKRIKDLYAARSKIVHGDASADAGDSIARAADAKELLRELIRVFWAEDVLRGADKKPTKLNVAFWEARYFLP